MITFSHLTSRGARRCSLLILLLVVLVAAPRPAASAVPAGYNWPVKPFDQAHPVYVNCFKMRRLQ